MSNLNKALELALVSCFDVFPVIPGTKMPYTEHGSKDASREQGQIEAWWKQWPDALVGVPTGVNNIAVLDIDVKKGKDGYEALRKRSLVIPETFYYDTPSGGRHYVYNLPSSRKFKQQTNYDALEGVDRQTGHSYVVWHGETPWTETELTKAPSWLLAKGVAESEDYNVQAYSGDLGEWAKTLKPRAEGDYATQAFLFDLLAEPHIGNGELQRFTYRLAFLAQEGHPATQEAYTELVNRYRTTSNEDREKQDAELDRLLRGAIADAQAADAAGDLEHWAWSEWTPTAATTQDAIPAAETDELKVLTREELRNMPKPKWIIPDLLKESSLAILAGSGGLGKTALALYLAECVATGRTDTIFPSFPLDQAVEPSKVLYVGAEGIEDFDSRLNALEDYHKMNTALVESNMHFIEEGVNLSEAGSMDRLSKLVKENQYKLIVLDTFSQLAHVRNENDAADISSVMRTAKRLRTLSPGSCVLFIHHATKDGAGYRGSSALRDNVDTLIAAWGKSSGFSLSTEAENNGKQRSGRPLTIKGLEVLNHMDSLVIDKTGASTVTAENEAWLRVSELMKDGTPRTIQQIADGLGMSYDWAKDNTKKARAAAGPLIQHSKQGQTIYWVLVPTPGQVAA